MSVIKGHLVIPGDGSSTEHTGGLKDKELNYS